MRRSPSLSDGGIERKCEQSGESGAYLKLSPLFVGTGVLDGPCAVYHRKIIRCKIHRKFNVWEYQKVFVFARTVGDAGPYNFCKNTPFEHDVKPYITELKVFCPSFFQKRGRGLGRRPIKPSNPSTAVFAHTSSTLKVFGSSFFQKGGRGLGRRPI